MIFTVVAILGAGVGILTWRVEKSNVLNIGLVGLIMTLAVTAQAPFILGLYTDAWDEYIVLARPVQAVSIALIAAIVSFFLGYAKLSERYIAALILLYMFGNVLPEFARRVDAGDADNAAVVKAEARREKFEQLAEKAVAAAESRANLFASQGKPRSAERASEQGERRRQEYVALAKAVEIPVAGQTSWWAYAWVFFSVFAEMMKLNYAHLVVDIVALAVGGLVARRREWVKESKRLAAMESVVGQQQSALVRLEKVAQWGLNWASLDVGDKTCIKTVAAMEQFQNWTHEEVADVWCSPEYKPQFDELSSMNEKQALLIRILKASSPAPSGRV